MSKRRVLILGAGLAGLSAAWHLQKRGIDCQIFEKEPEVGGLCRSKTIDGFTFDYSGHLLHFRHQYTFNLVKSLLGNNLARHERSSWVYIYGRYLPYPFQANLYGLPQKVLKECLLGFIQTLNNGHLKNKRDIKFSTWIKQTFGLGIAKHFMVPYNTKFWTVPPQELTCEWLDGFIPVPTLKELIEGTIEENRREFGYNSHFWYPKRGGIAQLPLALASEIKNIYTNCEIQEIGLKKKEIKMLLGDKEKFDYLISTIPLPELSRMSKDSPKDVLALFKKLRWNSIFNLNLGLDKKDNDLRHWIYYPHQDTCFFRIGFPHNFSPNLAPSAKSSIYIEVAYSKDKPINKSKILLRMKEDLKKLGLVVNDNAICIEDINDIKYGYPIYDKNYSLARDQVLQFLSKNSIIPCGRYGSWRYLSMEDTILEAQKICLPLYKKY